MNKVAINLHGELGKLIGSTWNLAVSSVSEAVHAIQILSKRRFFPLLLANDKKNIKYDVLINGQRFIAERELKPDDIDAIKNSELMMKIDNLFSIDIIPILEGADSKIFTIIAGVILVIIGLFPGFHALIVVGIGLIAAGVISLLSKPPKFEDFHEISQGGKTSYLFDGPQNTVGEGGPVPIGYGRLMIGSQVISASYDIFKVDNEGNITDINSLSKGTISEGAGGKIFI